MQKYEAIERGILEKDLEALRESVGSLCYTCRNFKNGEFDEVVEYVISRGIPLIDPELSGELVSAGKESFTDADFARAVFELKENFCKERIADVKKIGEALYPNDHEAAEDGIGDGAVHPDAADANEDADRTEGEYRSKYDNGKSNPIKSLLRAVCDLFSPKEESREADDGDDLFKTIANGIESSADESGEKLDTPRAEHTPFAAEFDGEAGKGAKADSADGDYFKAYRVSEDEMKSGSSEKHKKLDTSTPEAFGNKEDTDNLADQSEENADTRTDQGEEGKKDGSKKIDPLYIAAGAVGVAALALIIIAFLK